MKPVNTIILVLLAAGLFAFIYFVESHWHPPVPVLTRVLPRLDAAQVNSLSIEPQGEFAIVVERTNGVWRMIKPQTNRLRDDVVDKFLRTLEALTAQTRISAEELHNRPDPIAEYGFGKPRYSIVVQQGTETPVRLNLGGSTPQGDAVYAQVVGFDYVDLVPADFTNSLPEKAEFWRDPAFIPLDTIAFDRVQITSTGVPYELLRDPATKVWSVGGAFPARADNAQVNKSLKELLTIRAVHFQEDAPTNLAAFGLRPPRLEISFYNGDTNTVLSLEFGANSTDEPALVYARAGTSNSIVLLAWDALKEWRTGPDSFREKHLLSPEDLHLRSPDTFIISGLNQPAFTLEVRSNTGITNGMSVRVVDAEKNNYPGDPDAVGYLLYILANMPIVSQDNQLQKPTIEANQPRYGLGTNPVRRYLLEHTSAFDTNFTGTNITAQVDFGIIANSNVYARRSDLSNELSYVYTVQKINFDLLPATPLDFRDHHVWNFSASNVARVTFRASGLIQKWNHQKEYEWKSEDPIGFTDSVTNMQMGFSREAFIDNLGDLIAGRWVERMPADKARYGITDTSSQIKVETKENGVARTNILDIGGLSPSGQRYGLVTMGDDGKEWVFEFLPKGHPKFFDLKQLQQYFQLPDPF